MAVLSRPNTVYSSMTVNYIVTLSPSKTIMYNTLTGQGEVCQCRYGE